MCFGCFSHIIYAAAMLLVLLCIIRAFSVVGLIYAAAMPEDGCMKPKHVV
jgi:hypothetical protein